MIIDRYSRIQKKGRPPLMLSFCSLYIPIEMVIQILYMRTLKYIKSEKKKIRNNYLVFRFINLSI